MEKKLGADVIQLPTPERQRHHKIEVASEQIQDSEQGIGRPFRIVDVLTLLERRGTISREWAAAGERFRDDYDLAQLDPLKAADVGRIPGLPSTAQISLNAMEARNRVWGAYRKLGGPPHESTLANCIEWVVGRQRSIAGWAFTGGVDGTQMRHEIAAGFLRAGLELLANYYREVDSASSAAGSRGNSRQP